MSSEEEEMVKKPTSGSVSSYSIGSGDLHCSVNPEATYYRYRRQQKPQV